MTLPIEGQPGHLQKHADIDTLIAGHTNAIAAGDVTNPASAAGIALKATFVSLSSAPIIASRYATLQLAADAVPASGGDLRIPPGTYTGNVSFKPKTRVAGAGRESTIIRGTVTFENADSTSLSDLTITGVSPGTTGLLINGGYRFDVTRVNIENHTGNLLHIRANGTPVYYGRFSDVNLINHAGGGRGIYLNPVGASDWITALTFDGVTVRGTLTDKLVQGVRLDGAGVVQHTRWSNCYIEYVTYEGWYCGPTTDYQHLDNVTVEAAGVAYSINGDYVTALGVKHFGCTVGWEIDPVTVGHEIIAPGANQFSTLNIGGLRLRNNAGILEKSTNGTTWTAV